MTIWIGFSKNNKNSEMENNINSPYRSSPTWFLEQGLLNIYFLLAHRIKGLGWSLNDFWEADTWTTSTIILEPLDWASLDKF